MPRYVGPLLVFAAAFAGSVATILRLGALPTSARCVAAGVVIACVALPSRISWNGCRRTRAALAGLAAAVLLVAPLPESSPAIDERLSDGPSRGLLRATVTEAAVPLHRGWIVGLDGDSLDAVPLEGTSGIRLFVPDDRLPSEGPPLPGAEVRVFVELERYPPRLYPRRASPRRRMRRRGVVARGVAEDDLEVEHSRGETVGITAGLASIRQSYLARLFRRVGSPAAEYAAAITAGARGRLEPRHTDPFRRTGTGHLLAISGLHLGALATILWWGFGALAGWFPSLLRRWGRRRVCTVPVLATLAAYVWAIGAPVSALRALLMVAAVVGALAVDRPAASLRGLAAAAVVLIGLEPARVARLGFQLSFGATGAILLFLARRPPSLVPPSARGEGESPVAQWARRAALAAGISMSATLATWPVLLFHLGWVPVDSLWINLLVPPLVGSLLVPAMLAGGVGLWVAPPVGARLLEAAGTAVAWLAVLLGWLAARPPGALVTGCLSAPAALAAETGVLLSVGSKGRWRPLVVGAGLVVLSVAPGLIEHATRDDLRVHFLPVGQGDATLVEFPDGRTMLVDAGGQTLGNDPGRRIVAPYLRRTGIGDLDWIVGTHADVDHIGGIPAVAHRMGPASFIYDPGAGPAMTRLARRLRRLGTRGIPLRRTWSRRIGGVDVRILRPAPSNVSGDNDRSLVTILEYRGRRIVLPGDIETSTERALLDRLEGPCTVLKAPHHGSSTSSSPAFLEALTPKAAVASAGRHNPFGHPAPSVVHRYQSRGIAWYETARDGLVRAVVRNDGSWTMNVLRR